MSALRRIPSLILVALAVLVLQGCASGPPPTPTELGEAALAEGDWRAAQSHFAAALRQDASNARAWHGQSRAQLAGRPRSLPQHVQDAATGRVAQGSPDSVFV